MNIYSNASLIILGSLISLTISGCDKTESTPANTNTSQQIQDNAPPNNVQTTEPTDNSVPAEPVPDEPTELQQEDQTAGPSDVVKMVEYNEYTVKGVRDILRFPGAGGSRKTLPQKIELKVRCLADNSELCECLDGAYRPAEYFEGTRYIVSCDRTISTVNNVHKHGTINSFEKLLKHVKQSPEKHQYAVSFMTIKPEKDDHSSFQTIEIRKLCPVQDGIISEDCECFKAESHDPNTFLVTRGRVTKCP